MSMYDPIINAIHRAAQRISGGINSKIRNKADLVNGVIPASQIPPEVFERMKVVADDEAEDRAALVELVDSGAKNLLDLTKATSVSAGAGITYTLAADGTLTVTWEGLTSGKTLKFKGLPYISGALILSGVQSLTDPTAFRADVRQGETPETRTDIRAMDYGESPKESFTLLSDVYDYVIRIDVPSGESSTSGTAALRPMICSKAAWDISQTIVPHCPTLPELYALVKQLHSL